MNETNSVSSCSKATWSPERIRASKRITYMYTFCLELNPRITCTTLVHVSKSCQRLIESISVPTFDHAAIFYLLLLEWFFTFSATESNFSGPRSHGNSLSPFFYSIWQWLAAIATADNSFWQWRLLLHLSIIISAVYLKWMMYDCGRCCLKNQSPMGHILFDFDENWLPENSLCM